ncbi:MAG TPA: hypothetical protein VGD58_28460 [Herpetosiphonaceae bacterium]
MTDNSLARVNYFARQFLGTQDFAAEQQYHLAMQRRHNIALHRWGIVAGLELSLDNDKNLQLLPGMAIDGYGREIILATIQPLSPHWFDEKGSDTLDVLIEYQLRSSDFRSQGLSDCDADDSNAFYRWQEEPVVRLARATDNLTNRREPGTVPEPDHTFEPFRVPPDDPQYDWPVFLGQISRERLRPGQPYSYTFSHDNRPYAGLVGAEVVAPSGRARLELGASADEDLRRFGVFVQADPDPTQNQTQDPPDQPKDKLALEIDRAGKIDIHCPTTIHGNLTLDKSAIEFHAGVVNPPQGAWQIYYTDDQHEDKDKKLVINHELRIAVPKGTENSVVIGAWSPDNNAFTPCLSVGQSATPGRCAVTVHGDLVVNGTLYEKRARPAQQTSAEVQNILLQTALSSLGTTIGPVAGGQPSNESDLDVLKRALTTDAGRMLLAQALAGSSGQLETFMDRLLVLAPAEVIAQLLASDARIAELVKNMLASPNLDKVIRGFIEADQALALVTNQLLDQSNTARLQAVLTAVLKDTEGRKLLANVLAQDEHVASVIDELLKTSSSVLIGQLLKAPKATIQALIAEVLTSPTLPDFVAAIITRPELVKQLLLDENKNRLGEVLKGILEQADKRQDVVAALASVKEGQRKAFIRSLMNNNKAQSSLIGDPTALKAAAQLIIRSKVGQTAIVTALIELWNEDKNISKLGALVDALKAGPQELRTQLRKALEDPPPPTG